MLDLFRKRGLTSFVYGFIIVATIAVFVIQFNPNAGKKSASIKQACVATVKGWCVDPKDHKAVYRVLIPRDRSGAALTSRARQMGLNKIAVDALIERELLVSEADRLGLHVSEQEITDSIFDGQIFLSVPSDRPELFRQFPVVDGRVMPQLYGGFRDPKTKQFDMKTYERQVRALMGRSATEFREEQAREMLAAKVRDLLRAPIRVSETEAFDTYTREKSSATLTYVPVKLSFAERYLISNTAADVDAWAKDKANADLVDATLKAVKDDAKPKAGHIRHILVKVEPTASDSDKTAALNKLADGVRRIKAGEPFGEVAKAISDDTGSAARNGDVGDKTDGFVAPFKKAADALKPGEMTPAAIQTQFGYHIILKDDPSPEALKRETTHALYLKAKALDAAKDFANKINAEVKAGKSAEDAVKAALEPIVKKGASFPALASIAEEAPPPAAGDAGVAGAAAVMTGDAGAKAAPIVARAVTADDDPSRPRVETSSSFNRGGDPIADLGSDGTGKVLEFAFTGKEGAVMVEPLRTDDAFFVIQLKQQKTASRDEFTKDRDTYMQTLLTAKRAEALALYVQRLRESAKMEIKIDETLLQDPGANRDGGAPSPEELEEE